MRMKTHGSQESILLNSQSSNPAKKPDRFKTVGDESQRQLTEDSNYLVGPTQASSNVNQKNRKLKMKDLNLVNQYFEKRSNNNISNVSSSLGKSFLTSPNYSFADSSRQSLQDLKTQLADVQENRKFVDKMMGTIYLTPKDKNMFEFYGEDSIKGYYDHFKKVERAKQENKYFNLKDSAFTQMFDGFTNKKILPSKLGIIKETEKDKNKLNLKNMKYGDNYVEILQRGVSSLGHINKFYLSNNRITENSSEKLIKAISQQAEEIDLSKNHIGQLGIEHLSTSLQNKDCKLRYLNLEDNGLGNYVINHLLEALMVNTSLSILNISKNYLNETIVKNLCEVMSRGKLQELYLHWNQLNGEFGKQFFPRLEEDDTLKVLDLSNNSIGQKSICREEICQFLIKNQEMVHLDLSFNYFDFEDSKKIALALESNKTIYGFHFAGNSGYVDTRGFIVPEEVTTDVSGQISKKRINSCQVVRKIIREEREPSLRDCCWICDGWREMTFEWKGEADGMKDPEPLFIRFNFEDFIPNYFGKTKELVYHRMVPSGDLHYFYSTDRKYFPAKSRPQIPHHSKVIEQVKNVEDEYEDIEIHDLNHSAVQPQTILNKYYQPLIQILPRTRDPIYIPPKRKKTKQRWSFPISLFVKWRPDDAELINLCFEYDWECGKIPKIIKDEKQIAQVKEFFRERYKYIKDVYKYYASLNPVGDIWAIQNAPFAELIDKCQIIDSKVTQADVTIKWTSTIAGVKGATFLPASQIFGQTEKINQIVNLQKSMILEQQKSISGSDLVSLQNILPPKDVIEENEEEKLNQSKEGIDEEGEQEIGELSQQKAQPISNFLPETPKNKQPAQNSLRKQSTLVIASSRSLQKALTFNQDVTKSQQITSNHLKALAQIPVDMQSLQGGKNIRNPERGLNRYQMMEILVRIAEEKYINKLQKTKDYFEAVRMFWEDNLVKEFTNPLYDSQLWRDQRYWNEDCDYCLKNYKRIIDHVYKRFAVKKVKPGQTPFMCLDEFNTIVNQCGLPELEWFGATNYLTAFNNSMMTQIDELSNDRIFQMSQVEFIEALARVADEANLLPAPGVYEEGQMQLLEHKIKMPLGHKLEGLIVKLFENCCDIAFRSTHPPIKQSFFWKDPDESEFEYVD